MLIILSALDKRKRKGIEGCKGRKGRKALGGRVLTDGSVWILILICTVYLEKTRTTGG